MPAGFDDFNHSRCRFFWWEEKHRDRRLRRYRNTRVGQSRKAIERYRNVATASPPNARNTIGASEIGKCVEVYVDDRGIALALLMMSVIGLAFVTRRRMQVDVLIGRHNERLQQCQKQRK